MVISSAANAQIKNIRKLIKSRKERNAQGVFVVEGIRMFLEVPKDMLVSVYVTEEFAREHATELAGLGYDVVAPHVFESISDTKTPQGVLAVVKQPYYELKTILDDNHNAPNQKPCLLVLENVQDPGNLGTILRTAEGAGVTGIIMSENTVDIFNPKVIRSTMGAIFRVPFTYVKDLIETVNAFEHITTYAAHLDGSDFYQEELTGGIAFFIGNEGNGLSEKITKCAHRKIRIPMCGQVESLNAAVATTVLVYEALRQRLKGIHS
ncbi:MAG: TrmH family RNA methyltransferase [Lachnospiraceae bacterium]